MQRHRIGTRWQVAIASAFIVLGGSTAFACTNLATLNLSSSSGKPGDLITVTGTGFQASSEEAAMEGMVMEMTAGGAMKGMSDLAVRSQVLLRWNGPDGPVLSNAVPDRSGTISVIFTIPETASGQYMVLAVQKNPQGYDVYGTPARAPIQVIGTGQRGGDVQGAGTVGAGGQSSSTGIVLLTVGLGLLSVALFAGGGIAATRLARVRRGVPAKVGGRKD